MNKDAKYEIVEVHMYGLNITKFTVKSLKDEKKAYVTYADAIKLARGNKIKNANAFLDITSGVYILEFENGLGSIPLHQGTQITLTYRILDEHKNCVGYKAKDSLGKGYKLSIGKTWELASINSVNGITAKIIRGKKVLISNDGSLLSELPILKD